MNEEIFDKMVEALDGWIFTFEYQDTIEREYGRLDYAVDCYNRVHLSAIYVKPEYRGRGLAAELVRKAEEGRTWGIAWTATYNLSGQRVLEKLGYEYCGIVDFFYPNGDSAIMWRKCINGEVNTS